MADKKASGISLGRKAGIGCAVLLAVSCGPVPDSGDDSKVVAAPVEIVEGAGEGIEPFEQPVGKWVYSEEKDELRDSTDYFAQLQSENTVNFGFPYSGAQHLTILVRKTKAFGEDTVFQIEQGQFICGIYDCQGNISFDGKVESLTLVPPADHGTTALFAKFAPAIIRKLSDTEKVVVELQFYQEGNRQFTFDTTGFEWDH